MELCSVAAVSLSSGKAGTSSVARLRLRSILLKALLKNDSIFGAVPVQLDSRDQSYAEIMGTLGYVAGTTSLKTHTPKT